MATFSEMLSNVRRYCGNADDVALPLYLVRQVAWDQQRLMVNETILSDENWFLAKCNLGTPNSKDIVISAPNYSVLVSVERLEPANQDRDLWLDVPIVDRNDLNMQWRQGRKCAARYGTPPRMAFSWNPSQWQDTIRYWYEPTIGDNVLAAQPNVFSQCVTLLTFLTARGCRQLINLPELAFIEDSIQLGWEQFEKFARRTPEERPFFKQRAYGIRSGSQARWKGWQW